jgi:hypothetical protein
MDSLLRFVRALRRNPEHAWHAFCHRLRIGLAIAALILVFSFLW